MNGIARTHRRLRIKSFVTRAWAVPVLPQSEDEDPKPGTHGLAGRAGSVRRILRLERREGGGGPHASVSFPTPNDTKPIAL